MKLKVLPLSFFLYKSHIFNSFVPILNDKKASNIDLTGNVWSSQDANISSNNTQSTLKINTYSAS